MADRPRRRGRRGADARGSLHKADGGPGCAEQRSDGWSERPRAEQRKEAASGAPEVGTCSLRGLRGEPFLPSEGVYCQVTSWPTKSLPDSLHRMLDFCFEK